MKGFLEAGHLPALIAAFLYFDVSFMVWVLLGPQGPLARRTPAPHLIAKRVPDRHATTGRRTRMMLADYRRTLAQSDTLWFCLLYSITFGGFVGMASFLTVFFYDQYGLSKVQAGDFTSIVVCAAASCVRRVDGLPIA